jgi:myxalamid-type polyketide synthase MxaD
LRRWRQFYPKVAQSPLYARLAAEGDDAARPAEAARAVLLAAAPAQQQRLLEAHLREQAALVLRLAPSRLDPGAPFSSMGFDSLMAMELRNRLEASLDLKLPATLVWKFPTLHLLGADLARKLGLASAADEKLIAAKPAAIEPPNAAAAASVEEIAEMSDDEAEALLLEELGSFPAEKPRFSGGPR